MALVAGVLERKRKPSTFAGQTSLPVFTFHLFHGATFRQLPSIRHGTYLVRVAWTWPTFKTWLRMMETPSGLIEFTVRLVYNWMLYDMKHGCMRHYLSIEWPLEHVIRLREKKTTSHTLGHFDANPNVSPMFRDGAVWTGVEWGKHSTKWKVNENERKHFTMTTLRWRNLRSCAI